MASEKFSPEKHGITPHLEPRVVRLESDVSTILSSQAAMRSDIHELGKQISELTVAVTTAQGPRRTDWALVLTAVGMVITIGLLTISPLYTKQDRQDVLIREHVAMPMHPVGMKEVEYINKQADQRNTKYEARMDRIEGQHRRELDQLDVKIQKEFGLALEESKTKIAELDIRLQRELNLITTRTDARLMNVETALVTMGHDDSIELRQRRLSDDCSRKDLGD